MDDAMTADEVAVPPSRGVGRLVQPDEGTGLDLEGTEVADLVDDDTDALSAEEAAVHIIDEP
jgi:hypothetical protein